MGNKMSIRTDIVNIKEEYNKPGNRFLLLHAAILKGLYIALGGQKGINLPSKLNDITIKSKIIFTFAIKVSKGSLNKATDYLRTNSSIIQIDTLDNFEKYTITYIPELLSNAILSERKEDLVINHANIINIAVSILQKYSERW